MHKNLKDVDLENASVQWLVRELVRAGMETPLRDSILAAVEETSDEVETSSSEEHSTEGETGERSRAVKAIRSFSVFLVVLVAVYASFKWLTSKDEM